MAGDRGRIPYLGSHGYFVSTSSDEEDNFDRSHEYYSYEKYWRGDKERSLQGAADEVCDDKNLPQIERSGWNQSIAYPALGKAGCVRFKCYPNPDRKISNHVPSTEACQDCVNFQSMSVYLSSVQLRKSKACSEASNYSLQRSLELMARSTYTDMESDELAKKGSVQVSAKKRSKGCDTRSQSLQFIQPSREILACAVMRELPTNKQVAQVDHLEEISDAARNWSVSLGKASDGRVSGNCDDYLYHDPIDSELYYSHPQSFSQPEVKRLLGEVQNSHYKNTSDLFIVDLENNSEAAELYPSNTNSTVRPPLKERKGKAAHSKTNVAAYKRDYTRSQLQKELVSRKRSQERGIPAMKKKYSTDDCGPILKSLKLVKTFESDCLSREEHCLRTREKSFRYTDGDLVTSEGEKQRIQQTRVRITPMMKVLMHMDNFSHTDRPFAETDHETGGIGIECEQVPSSPPCTRIQKDKKDVSIVATTEMAPHNAGERKEFSTWQSSGESRETSQIEVVLGLMDNLSTNTLSSSPEVITAPKHRENAEARGMVKLGVPAYTRNKAKILTKINQSRGVREIGYQRSDDSAGSNVIDIGRKEAASPRSKHLRRRQLQTLKVVDHNTPRSDARAVTTTLNLPEGSRRAGDLKGTTCTKILTTDTIHLENSRTTRKHCNPKIDDEISSCFPEKENNAQSEVLELEEKESIEYMMAISEDQRLEMSSYPPPPQGEEKTSLLQHPSAESRVECYSQEVVQTQEPYSELDVDVQSNTLLQLLREMQNHRPGPATICDNTNAVKTGGMVDPAPQRGSYLAQYLKKQSRAGARRISMDK